MQEMYAKGLLIYNTSVIIKQNLEISSKHKKGGRSVDIGIIIALVSLIVEIIDLIINYKDNHKD